MTKAIRATAAQPTRVFVVDDHPVIREGLAALFSLQHDLEICGEAKDVAGALLQLKSARPDVVLIDISLQNGNGIDLIKRIRAYDQVVPILVWSMHSESLYAERALRAGAQGYVHKGQSTQEILDALRAVVAGKVYVSGTLANELLRSLIVGGKAGERAPIESLSDRELETFELLGHGLTTAQIAAKMHISPKTVETYRVHLKKKLNVASLAELVQRASQWVLENEQARE